MRASRKFYTLIDGHWEEIQGVSRNKTTWAELGPGILIVVCLHVDRALPRHCSIAVFGVYGLTALPPPSPLWFALIPAQPPLLLSFLLPSRLSIHRARTIHATTNAQSASCGQTAWRLCTSSRLRSCGRTHGSQETTTSETGSIRVTSPTPHTSSYDP